MSNWLVTGGVGYVGSHAVSALAASGRNVVVADNLSSGIAARLPEHIDVHVGDCRDANFLHQLMVGKSITGVVHLAANKQARESQKVPLQYWRNNVGSVLGLVTAFQ